MNHKTLEDNYNYSAQNLYSK